MQGCKVAAPSNRYVRVPSLVLNENTLEAFATLTQTTHYLEITALGLDVNPNEVLIYFYTDILLVHY